VFSQPESKNRDEALKLPERSLVCVSQQPDRHAYAKNFSMLSKKALAPPHLLSNFSRRSASHFISLLSYHQFSIHLQKCVFLALSLSLARALFLSLSLSLALSPPLLLSHISNSPFFLSFSFALSFAFGLSTCQHLFVRSFVSIQEVYAFTDIINHHIYSSRLLNKNRTGLVFGTRTTGLKTKSTNVPALRLWCVLIWMTL